MPTLERQAANPAGQVGYFCHLNIEEKHMGAILVTNQIGVPLEFKYTEPVVATKLHRILYGSVLERYLHETVIRDRLGREIRSTPSYFIAPYEEKEFLGSLANREMIAIQKCGLPPSDLAGPFTRIREREAIMELEGEPVFFRLAFSTSDQTAQEEMVSWIRDIARTMDVMEPLDRIASALTNICGEVKRV
jgi:hypothetical protein